MLLFKKLYSLQVDNSRDDKVRWEASSSKSFSASPIFRFFRVEMSALSHGGWFGDLKLPVALLFLLGRLVFVSF